MAADEPRRLRIAVVVQRYGIEINGGAELHARLWVKELSAHHQVKVLTTRAKDYTRWDAHYPAGEGEVEGIPVLRFDHPERGHSGRARVAARHLWRYRLAALWRTLGRARVSPARHDPAFDGQTYLERQGPCSTSLIDHLKDSASRYDLVIFFTALYHPSAAGLLACNAPAMLVPTLHDERSMMWPIFHRVFRRPQWVTWNCKAEKELAVELYGDDLPPGSVCGVGVETAAVSESAIAEVRAAFGLSQPYFVFVGRVSRSKGFDLLSAMFRLCTLVPGWQHRLVVIGQAFMPNLPQSAHITYTGFVSDAQRDALVAGATATCVSSRHESLSLVTLESMALGTPVIVNGRSRVLRAHARDSRAGLAYRGPLGLLWALLRMTRLTQRQHLEWAEAGRRYVAQNYSWEHVRRQLLSAVQLAARGDARKQV